MNLYYFVSWRVSSRRLLPLFALALAFTASAAAGDRPASGAAFAPETLKAHVTYLASDELRGRGSGDVGNEKAAQFIAREFARYGLKPLGTRRQKDPNAKLDGSGYYQPFQFPFGRIVGKKNALQATIGERTVRYRYDRDYELSGVSGAGTAEGAVVFVGYGIQAPQAKHDDYAGLDVKEKLVLLVPGAPKENKEIPASQSDIRRKAATARDLGAKAVLIAMPKDAPAPPRSPFEFASSAEAGLPVVRLHPSVVESWFQGVSASVNGQELKTPEALAEHQARVALRVRARLTADVTARELVTANIAGLIEGSDPVLKNEVVVIGAHMDHVGMGGPGSLATSSQPAIHPGADDNASGTAGVLALARYFAPTSGARLAAHSNAERPAAGASPLKRSLLFICFSAEELGLIGSKHYVEHPLIPLDKTVAMLNMDMIGRLRDNKLTVIGTGSAKEWPGLLATANQKTGFEISSNASGLGGSDHQSFFLKGIPVLFFFTGMHPEYHRPTDRAELVNAEGIARILQLVADCAERIADAPERPTYQRPAQPTAQGAARGGFRVYFGSVPNYEAQVEGVLLEGVREGSPAEKAGLKAGDIIIKFGGKSVRNVEEYTSLLGDYKPGDVVEVVVKRGSETLTFKVTLAERTR
jgi:hypothetical protein